MYLKKKETLVNPDYEFLVKIDNELSDDKTEINSNDNFVNSVAQTVNIKNPTKDKNYKIYNDEVFYL